MNHVKKMSLMPQEMAEKLLYEQRHKEVTQPQAHHAMQIDRQMQHILDRNDISEHDKALAYLQSLRSYLEAVQTSPTHGHKIDHHFKQEISTPGIPKTEEISKKDQPQQQQQQQQSRDLPVLTTDIILQRVPKYAKSKAKKLLKTFEADPNFKWNEKGEISIGGKFINSSNISDIIHSATSKRKAYRLPHGTEMVLSYLKDKPDVPNTAFNNQHWRKNLGFSPSKPKTPLSAWKSKDKNVLNSPDFHIPEWENWE